MALLHSWLRKREIGLNLQYGGVDSVYKTLYHTISSVNGGCDPENMQSPARRNEHGAIFNLEFSQSGNVMVAACEKNSIRMFDPITVKQVHVVRNAHNESVNCVKFLDDRMFATCSDDATVALWDIRNLKQKIRSLQGHSNWVKNIEYSSQENLLVTSGFDGSIFCWDINSYTEQGFVYQKVFNTPGLMRCRLSPDSSKLVICTTGGYLMIVHDLDLKTLARDLNGFKPNVYRLMQLKGQFIPNAAKFDYAFSKRQKRNRIEFVSDFPSGNDAEIISSLHIHPQGWCALSRNISFDESTEWTCIHDIQDLPPSNVENEIILQKRFPLSVSDKLARLEETRQSPPPAPASATAAEDDPNEQPAYRSSTSNNIPEVIVEPATDPPLPEPENTPNNAPYLDIWAAAISVQNRSLRNTNMGTFNSAHVYGMNSGIVNSKRAKMQQTIPQNAARLLYYVEEPSKGKGFIKELCFSSDGRIICSPYDQGIRLLSFSPTCSELSTVVEASTKPQPLNQIKILNCHPDIVVSTKFSPRFPLVVSGCLSGEIVWHQPRF